MGAKLVHPAPAGAQVTVTIAFRPRDPGLLARLAASSSARPGMSVAELRRLFAPAAGDTAKATRYLRGHGLNPLAGGILTRSFRGSVAAAESAFDTHLGTYIAAGTTFRSPTTSPQLPAGIAAGVVSVSGLDTYPTIHPAVARPRSAASPAVITASCPEPGIIESFFGFYQPADFASSTGYNFQALLDGGADGSGDALALVEFSNYSQADESAYQSCYGTSVPITDVMVNGGTTDTSGAVEVDLDQEVAATAAPGLDHIYTYIADPSSGSFASVTDQILSDLPTTHTSEVSISWGECEAQADPAEVAAAAYEYQLAAAAGVSVFAATGDSGSSGCPGSDALNVWYPASDPYVTAVGGTTLHTGLSGSDRETSWGSPDTGSGGGAGGGISTLFPMPDWQSNAGVVDSTYSSKSACGQVTTYCRELPDVALDANPDTGYIVYCTTPDCQGAGWTLLGGTSAGTPLLAAMTADANGYSLAHGGGRMGFASPLLYSHAGTGLFRDVTAGSNNIVGGLAYPAGVGYDMATGLGAPDGGQLATILAAATASPSTFDATSLTATESASTVSSTAPVSIKGTLQDTTAGQPLASRPVILWGSYSLGGHDHVITRRVTTDPLGRWTVPVTTALVKAKLQWHVAYTGEQGIRPAYTNWQTLHVTPTLTTASTAHWNGHAYTLQHQHGFKLSGVATPIMAGKKLTVQYRPFGGSTWHSMSVQATIGTAGKYSVGIVATGPGKEYLRFFYKGSSAGQWLSAGSAAKLFVVT